MNDSLPIRTCSIVVLDTRDDPNMTFDESGRIVEFKVMLRPLKAVNLMHARMKAMLEEMASQ